MKRKLLIVAIILFVLTLMAPKIVESQMESIERDITIQMLKEDGYDVKVTHDPFAFMP